MRLLGRGNSDDPYERFAAAFEADSERGITGEWTDADTEQLFGASSPLYSRYLTTRAAPSYDSGLWRLLLPGGSPDLRTFNGPEGWISDWPELGGLATFGYDWLGRLYVIDTDGTWTGVGTVLRFSPASGDVESATSTATGLDEYLFRLLPKRKAQWLDAAYFADWLRSGGRALRSTECVSYVVPLVLGGTDDIPNLELSDLMTYLSASGQIHEQLRDVPEGTVIERVTLDG